MPQESDAFLLGKGEGGRIAEAEAKRKSKTEADAIGGNN